MKTLALALLLTVSSGSAEKPKDISPLLRPILEKHGIPGMAGLILDGDKVEAIGAVGVRRAGSGEKITTEDRFHLGSCTKSMTATLLAMLVEEKKLSWDSTPAGVFPELAAKMHPDWKDAKLELFLNHTSGAPANLDADGLWGRLWAHAGTPREMRRTLLEEVLAKPPAQTPGAKHVYANAGYAIAGAMAEQVMKKPWEELMRERLFAPLGMKSAGFGAPGDRQSFSEPRGHDGAGKPVEPGPGSDNPAAIGPAGTVHASLGDWAKYIALHLQGERGDTNLLKRESFRKLHEALPGPAKNYALGWGLAERAWGDGRVLTHSGSNTMWYCVVWMAPKKDFAVLIACNRAGDEAAKGCDEAAWALIQEHLKAKKP